MSVMALVMVRITKADSSITETSIVCRPVPRKVDLRSLPDEEGEEEKEENKLPRLLSFLELEP